MMNILQTLQPAMEWLLRVSGQSVVLVVLILLVQALGRERIPARWRHALWLLLVLRLALPVQLPSRFSLFNLAHFQPKAIPAGFSNPSASRVATSPEMPTAPANAISAAPASASPAAAPPPGPETAPAEHQRDEGGLTAWGWKTWLPLLWLAGAAVLVLRMVAQNVVFFRRLRWAPTVTDSQAWQTLEDCRKLMGVRQRLVLVESETIHSPALYGFLRLHLLLPRNTLANLSMEELRFVFLHELAHVKRRDMLVNWVVTVLQIIHWFNPLVWLGFRRMAADREMAADALALSCLEPRENVAYGNAILNLLRTLMRPAALPGLVGILEDNNQMKRRMSMIATFRKTNRWPIPAALAFVGIALVALTDPSAGADRKPLKLSGKPPADLAVLRVWSCTNYEMSSTVGVSSDGRYMAYADPDTGDLTVRDLFKGKSQRLTRIPAGETWKEYAEQSVISPDGSQVAYTWCGKNDRGQLRVINRDGTGSRVLYKQHSGTGWFWPHGWSADGRQVIVVFKLAYEQSSEKQIALISAQDGSKRVLARPRDLPEAVALSPDGRFLVYDTQAQADSKNREIRLVPVAGGGEVLLLGGPWNNQSLGWSADGQYLLFASNRRGSIDCWAQRMEDGKTQGQPELVKADLGTVTPMGITRGGGMYYRTEVGYEEVQIARLDLESGRFVTPPTTLAGRCQSHDWQPQWSPDGKQLAYISTRNDCRILCVRSMETGQDREYSAPGANFHWAAWSADGKSIRLLTTQLNEDTDTFRLDLGTGGLQRTKTGEIFAPVRADENIALRYKMDAPEQILVEDLRNASKKVLYTFADNESHGRRMDSPDGRHLAFMCVREEPAGWSYMLKVVPVAGGEVRQVMFSTNSLTAFDWLPDNRRLLCCSEKQFFIVSTDGTAPRRLGPAPECQGLSLHPDGQQVAFTVAHSQSELWLLENAVPAPGKARKAGTRR